MGFDWKAVVGTVAPTIATALGGPLAGLATTAIAGALGLGDGATEEQISAAMGKATPETLLALKKADQDFSVRMRELEVDLERLAMADRASARKREAATGDNWTPRLLAAAAVFTFVACVGFVCWLAVSGQGNLDPLVMGMLGTMFGVVAAKIETVYNYYLGSSSGSQCKDHLLYKSTPAEVKSGQ